MAGGAAAPTSADLMRTGRQAPRKNWCFTGWPDHMDDPGVFYDEAKMTYLLIGYETCPESGKDHFQCFVQFKNKIRFNGVKAIFGNEIHLEACKGSPEQNITYCKKGGTYNEYGNQQLQGARNDLKLAAEAAKTMTFEELMEDDDHGPVVARHMQYFRTLYANWKSKAGLEELREKYKSVALRDWQAKLLDIIKAEPDPRHVYWFWDDAGNTGKSWFAGYAMAWHDASVFTNGKLADMAFAYNYERVVILDLARTQAEQCDHFYQLIESLKNGCLFSSKYESKRKLFAPPHVVVFANFQPDRSKLSADRWKVKCLDGSEVGS